MNKTAPMRFLRENAVVRAAMCAAMLRCNAVFGGVSILRDAALGKAAVQRRGAASMPRLTYNFSVAGAALRDVSGGRA